MAAGELLRQLLAAPRPNLEAELAAFTQALYSAQIRGGVRTVGVVGLGPGQGRSTVSALMALVAAGYTRRRVVVIDTVRDPGNVRRPRGARGPTTVTSLLGGQVGTENLDLLLAVPESMPVARSRLSAAATNGAAATVLGLPAGEGGAFAPQILDQAIARLTHRADLLIIDTPAGPRGPVLHSVMHAADHLIVAVRSGRGVGARIDEAMGWIAAAPGRPRSRPVSVAIVPSNRSPGPGHRWSSTEIDSVRLPFDAALRQRRLTGLKRGTTVAGLRLLSGLDVNAAQSDRSRGTRVGLEPLG